MYLQAEQEGDRDGVSLNNLAWLAALKDKRFKEALDYANKRDLPQTGPTRLSRHPRHDLSLELATRNLPSRIFKEPSPSTRHRPSKLFHLVQAYLANNDKEKARQSLDAAKAKGFTPSGLHVLEQEHTRVYSKNWDRNDADDVAGVLAGAEASEWSKLSCFSDHGFKVLTIIIGNLVGELFDLLDRDKPHAVSNFLEAGDLESLP